MVLRNAEFKKKKKKLFQMWFRSFVLLFLSFLESMVSSPYRVADWDLEDASLIFLFSC